MKTFGWVVLVIGLVIVSILLLIEAKDAGLKARDTWDKQMARVESGRPDLKNLGSDGERLLWGGAKVIGDIAGGIRDMFSSGWDTFQSVGGTVVETSPLPTKPPRGTEVVRIHPGEWVSCPVEQGRWEHFSNQPFYCVLMAQGVAVFEGWDYPDRYVNVPREYPIDEVRYSVPADRPPVAVFLKRY